MTHSTITTAYTHSHSLGLLVTIGLGSIFVVCERLLLDVVELVYSLLPGHELAHWSTDNSRADVCVASPRTPLLGRNDLQTKRRAFTTETIVAAHKAVHNNTYLSYAVFVRALVFHVSHKGREVSEFVHGRREAHYPTWLHTPRHGNYHRRWQELRMSSILRVRT